MPHIDVTVSCPVFDSFRVQQVAGMFDVPLARRASERFQVDIADWDDAWRIGLIVGPSGSGKSTIAREIFGPQLYRRAAWPEDRAVIDCVLPEAAGGTAHQWHTVDQGDHPAVHGRGIRLAAELGKAIPRAEQWRAIPLRPGPGAGGNRSDGVRGVEGGVNASHRAPAHLHNPHPTASGFRRVHQRGGPQRGPRGIGRRGPGDPARPDRLPFRGRHLPL